MIWSALLLLVSVPVVAATFYLFVLAVLARRPTPSVFGGPRLKFDVVVPAHDEEAVIERTVRSLKAIDYPAALWRLRVVADNCSDRTAELAAGVGAEVLVRTDADERGKGYALAYAFERSLSEGFADAVVVIDADTVVSPTLLSAFEAEIAAGAAAVQAEYGVLNQDASWRTRLMTIAFTTFHLVRSSARERLRLSAGLRGNGMAFTLALLRKVPHRAFSVVEDLEYGIRIGEAGFRVHYRGDVEVRGEMAASEQASRSQRERWEDGRFAMARAHALRLLWRGLREGNRVLLDLACDLLVPPLTTIVLLALLGSTLALSLAVLHRVSPSALGPWLCTDLFLGVYLFRGWQLSGVPVSTLAWAPVYVAWKLGLKLRRKTAKRGEWVRTAREGKSS